MKSEWSSESWLYDFVVSCPNLASLHETCQIPQLNCNSVYSNIMYNISVGHGRNISTHLKHKQIRIWSIEDLVRPRLNHSAVRFSLEILRGLLLRHGNLGQVGQSMRVGYFRMYPHVKSSGSDSSNWRSCGTYCTLEASGQKDKSVL